MSFLKLSPAARHLRRIAKAHAAGEVPRQDYRRARRRIIEELHVDFSGHEGANTGTLNSPFDRFSVAPEDETRRRVGTDGRNSVQKTELADEVSHQPQADLTKRQQAKFSIGDTSRMKNLKGLRILLLAAVCLVILLGTFSVRGISIPIAEHRDPNPNNSLTFLLRSLSVEGYAGLPGLSRDEVDSFLKEQLSLARAEAEVERRSGFSVGELQELGDLLLRLGIQTEQGLDQSATFALNALAEKQRERRGVSIVQLDRIAERLEKLFRERGYLAARAYIPAQEVVADSVALHVLPGKIGKVAIDSHSPLAGKVGAAFSALVDRVAERETLEALFYKLNSLPGVRATGSLGAGELLGETQLDIILDNPRKLVSSFSLDNFGDDRSSRYRLNAQLEWLSPTGRGDKLTVKAALKHEPETAGEAGIRYQFSGMRLGDTFSTSYAHSNFDVDPRRGATRIHGRAQTLDANFNRVLVGSRTSSLSMGGSAALQKLSFADTHQKLWWVSPSIRAHKVLDASRWVLRGGLNLTAGDLQSDRYFDQPSIFVVGEGWLSAWKPLGEYSVRLDLAAQHGTEDLPDSHKFRLGGLRRNLAIRPGGFIADSAIFTGVEVVATPEVWRKYGNLKFFSRMSHGQVQLSGNRESAFVWDGGIGWKMPFGRQFIGSMYLSFPFVTNGMEDSHDSARFLFDISWRPGDRLGRL